MSQPAPPLLSRRTAPAWLQLAPDPSAQAATAGEAAQLRQENRQLQQAMESRPVIDQARGMIMALGPCSSDEAWQLLVEVSQHTNTKLREIAGALVATTTGKELPARLQPELRRALHRLRTTRP